MPRVPASLADVVSSVWISVESLKTQRAARSRPARPLQQSQQPADLVQWAWLPRNPVCSARAQRVLPVRLEARLEARLMLLMVSRQPPPARLQALRARSWQIQCPRYAKPRSAQTVTPYSMTLPVVQSTPRQVDRCLLKNPRTTTVTSQQFKVEMARLNPPRVSRAMVLMRMRSECVESKLTIYQKISRSTARSRWLTRTRSISTLRTRLM